MNLVPQNRNQSTDVLVSTWKNSRPHGFYSREKRIKKGSRNLRSIEPHQDFSSGSNCETSGRAIRGCPPLLGMWVNIQRDTALLDQERIWRLSRDVIYCSFLFIF
ncbi:hypothetical protein TNIN_486311 [Trichonephila inaurata madagascariensis]|uniref:Uncharacterized protein n=1 Tax=Trichonephila inaurata madagascariensis TaxID=2747483 RepID=A0A8X6X6D7_9ARAC|nr:hypothetical protein TNIN_486311 [Trichonephila inaurata madagascariensis]